MIYHIASVNEWEQNRNRVFYIPKRFYNDGFIHCSTNSQINKIANGIFANQEKIYLLRINDLEILEHIIYENLEGGTELFPHIYALLLKSNIVKVEEIIKQIDQPFDIKVL